MITRNGVIQHTDLLYSTYEDFYMGAMPRLASDEISELQDQYNVNQCDECDDWFDAEPVNDGTITIIEELEFWERFGDVEIV